MTYPTTQPIMIKINGVDRTSLIDVFSIVIENVITKQVDTARFTLRGGGGLGLADLQEVVISNPAGTLRYFGGFIESLREVSRGPKLDYNITCTDYAWLLDHPAALVNAEYINQDDSAIIDDFMDEACPDIEDNTYVSTVRSSLERQRYPRMKPRQVLERLAEISGADWYVDYGPAGAQKAYLHYFKTEENPAPFELSDAPDLVTSFPYSDLLPDKRAVSANLIEVVGGDYLSNDQTFYLTNDGDKDKLLLPIRCNAPTGQSGIQVWRNDGSDEVPSWTALTVGTGYIHSLDNYGCLHYFEEKFIEFASPPPNLTKSVKVGARYRIPLRQRVRDYVSYAAYGRWMADTIMDTNITDQDTAKKRGRMELAKRAATQVSYTCSAYEPGLKAGQYIRLVNTARSLDDYFLIQRVVTRFLGAGHARFDLELGLYNPDLIDTIVALKRLERPEWTEGEVLVEILDIKEDMDISDGATASGRGTAYYWAPHSPDSQEAKWDHFTWG